MLAVASPVVGTGAVRTHIVVLTQGDRYLVWFVSAALNLSEKMIPSLCYFQHGSIFIVVIPLSNEASLARLRMDASVSFGREVMGCLQFVALKKTFYFGEWVS